MQTSSNVTLNSNFKPSKRPQRFIKATITPAVAQAMLETFNTRNRNLTDSTVEAYARDMASGRWKYNGEAIKFSNQGTLTNGQHRLKACVVSGVNLVTDVLTGMDADSVLTEDTGKSRSVSDVIGISTGAKETLSVSRLRSVRNVIKKRRTRLTVADFQDLKAEFLKGVQTIESVATMRSGLGRAPVAAALIIAAQAYPVIILAMVEAVIAGNVSTNAQRLLHKYVLVSNIIESEDETTHKVLYACMLEVIGKNGSEKRLQTKSPALGFFLSTVAKQGGTMASAFLEDAKNDAINPPALTEETPMVKKAAASTPTINPAFTAPVKATVRRDSRV